MDHHHIAYQVALELKDANNMNSHDCMIILKSSGSSPYSLSGCIRAQGCLKMLFALFELYYFITVLVLQGIMYLFTP